MKYLKRYNENIINYYPGGYQHGGCNVYAIALHKLSGYPLYTVRGFYREDDWEEVLKMGYEFGYYHEDGHVVVKAPNGKYIDSESEYTEEELIDATGFGPHIERIEIVPLTELEAYNLYYGCDEQEDIKDQENNEVNKILKDLKQNNK